MAIKFLNSVNGSSTLYFNGADDNSGRADFAVKASGTYSGTAISLRSGQFQFGGDDINYEMRMDSYSSTASIRSWDRDIYIRTQSGSTSHHIAFVTADLGTDSEKMRITGDGKVGIGTTTPSYTLDVNGRAQFRNDVFINGSRVLKNVNSHLYLDSATGFGIYLRPNNGSTAMYINSSGNVGIGTTSPVEKLHVVGHIRVDAGSSGYLKGPAGEMLIGEDSGALYVGSGFGVNPAIPVFYGSNGTTYQRWKAGGGEMMRLTSTGLGIGTTSPSEKLDVVGSIELTQHLKATAGNLSLSAGGNQIMNIDLNGKVYPNTDSAYDLGFSSTLAWRNLYIDNVYANGNVGIGTTSPSEKLHVNGHLKLTGSLYSSSHTSGTITSGKWYRIIEITGGSGRGKCEFALGSGGGSGTPFVCRGAVTTAWSNDNSTLTIYHNSLGAVQEMRVVRNATDNNSYVDVKLSSEDNVIIEILNSFLDQAYAVDFTDVSTLPTGDEIETSLVLTGKSIASATNTTNTQYSVRTDSSIDTVAVRLPSGQALAEGANFLYIDPSGSFGSGVYINNRVKVDGGLIGSYNEDLQLRTGDTTRMILSNSTGNVGIGTTSPSATLDVAGSTVINGTRRGGTLQVNDFNDNTDGVRIYGYSNNEMLSIISRYDQAEGGLFFKRGNNGIESTIGQINFVSNQFRIDATVGSFLMGTAGSAFLIGNSDQSVRLPAYGAGVLTTDASGNVTASTGYQTQATADGRYVNVTGDTMTGKLVISSSNYDDHLSLRRDAYGMDFILTGTRLDLSPTASTNEVKVLAKVRTTSDLQVDGNTDIYGSYLNVGRGLSTAEATLTIGQARTDSGYSYIDLVGDTTYTDYGARFIRGNTGANASTQIRHRGTGFFDIYAADNAAVRFITNSLERMRVAGDGNVGIGTTSPSYKLDIAGDVQVQSAYFLRFANEWGIQQTGANLNFAEIGSADGRLYLKAGGNVGIGTTSPSQKLEVAGNIELVQQLKLNGDSPYIWGTGTGAMRIKHTSGNTMYIRPDEVGLISIFEGAATPQTVNFTVGAPSVVSTSNNSTTLQFTTKSKKADGTAQTHGVYLKAVTSDIENNYSRLDVTGANTYYFDNRVGIATTSPAAELDVNGTAQMSTGVTENTHYVGVSVQHWGDGGTGMYFNTDQVDFRTASVERMRITSNGNVGIGTTSPQSLLHVAKAGNRNGGSMLIGETGSGTDKWSYLAGAHYNQSTGSGNGSGSAGVALIGSLAAETYNRVYIGGGPYEINPATEIQFWTHTATTHTLGGTKQMSIKSDGSLQLHQYTAGYLKSDASGNITVDSSVIEDTLDSVTDRDNTTTNSIVVGGVGSSGEVALYAKGTADATNTEYDSQHLRFSTSGWDTNNSVARAVHWNVRAESTSTIYPDATLTFYEEDPSYDHWKLKMPGRGSGSGYSHPDAAYFNGNVGIGTTSISDGDLNINDPRLHVRGVDTTGAYSLVARFQSGSDADNTGAAIAINHSNDRGLLIKAGRKDSDRPVAFFDLIDSNGSTTNMLTMGEYGSDFRTGIGTTAPVATLDVAGTGRFTNKVQITGSTTIGWGDIANSYLLVGTDNAGIGIDSNEIAVEGSHLYFGTITSGHNIVFRSGGLNEMWMTSDTLFYKGGFRAGFENAAGDNTIYLQNTGGTGVSKLDIGGTVLIEEGGNVGIGTTAPDEKLEVSGNIKVTGDIVSTATSLYDLLPSCSFTYTMNAQLTADTWTEVFAGTTVLPSSGTYIVQVFLDDHAQGGQAYDEYYSGTMSWKGANTNETGYVGESEIVLHRNGHAANNQTLYLRTLERALSTSSLEVKVDISHTAATNIIFKFVRVI